jgi:hypothetical protein
MICPLFLYLVTICRLLREFHTTVAKIAARSPHLVCFLRTKVFPIKLVVLENKSHIMNFKATFISFL